MLKAQFMAAPETLGECGRAPLLIGYVRRYFSLNLLSPYLFRRYTSSSRSTPYLPALPGTLPTASKR